MKEIVLIICIAIGFIVVGFCCMLVDYWLHKIRTRISFKHSLEKSELAIIPLYNNGVKLNFIIDSGSNVNVLNKKHLDKLSMCMEKMNTSGIQSAGLGGNKGTECIITMELKSDHETFFQPFYVMDITDALTWAQEEYGEEVHGLLGVDFLRDYGKVIDFDDCIIYSKR